MFAAPERFAACRVCTNPYRRDIDGLRGIAVIAVLFYHLGTPGFGGGFVGVDVFFVISGYLITRLIRDEVVASGTFQFGNFYVRRARRLLPALFFTLAASAVVAAALFPPHLLEQFSGSLVSALLSFANVWFWSQSGYFDTSAITKPLLHTWSLAVEEQFYLIWPALLFVIIRYARSMAAMVIISISAASLLWNIDVAHYASRASGFSALLSSWSTDPRSTIFYLLPFRAFELGIGAAIVWLPANIPNLAREGFAALGLALIGASIFFYSDQTIFPSYNAMAPCLGTALMICAGQSSALSRLYDNTIAAGIGLISYSLYLVHWPLIVFFLYWRDAIRLTPIEQVSLIVVALITGVLMYRFIEQPFRHATASTAKSIRFIGAAASLTAVLSLAAGHAFATRGWAWRYPQEVLDVLRTDVSSIGLPPLAHDCFMAGTRSYRDIPRECFEVDRTANKKAIALLGDSTAYHLVPGLLATLGDRYAIHAFSTANCAPVPNYVEKENSHCPTNMAAFLTTILAQNRYDLVIVSNNMRWEPIVQGFPETAARLDELGIRYVLLGQVPFFKTKPANTIARHGPIGGLDESLRAQLIVTCDDTEHGLDRTVPAHFFISMKKLLCREASPVYEIAGRLIHKDHIHLNEYGSLMIAQRIANILEQRQFVSSKVSRASAAESDKQTTSTPSATK